MTVELIDALRKLKNNKNDSSAACALYDICHKPLFMFAETLYPDRQMAENATAESLEACLLHIAELRALIDFYYFLLRSVSDNAAARLGAMPLELPVAVEDVRKSRRMTLPKSAIENNELREALIDRFYSLPYNVRAVTIAFCCFELDADRLSEIYSCPMDTIRAMVSFAHAALLDAVPKEMQGGEQCSMRVLLELHAADAVTPAESASIWSKMTYNGWLPLPRRDFGVGEVDYQAPGQFDDILYTNEMPPDAPVDSGYDVPAGDSRDEYGQPERDDFTVNIPYEQPPYGQDGAFVPDPDVFAVDPKNDQQDSRHAQSLRQKQNRPKEPFKRDNGDASKSKKVIFFVVAWILAFLVIGGAIWLIVNLQIFGGGDASPSPGVTGVSSDVENPERASSDSVPTTQPSAKVPAATASASPTPAPETVPPQVVIETKRSPLSRDDSINLILRAVMAHEFLTDGDTNRRNAVYMLVEHAFEYAGSGIADQNGHFSTEDMNVLLSEAFVGSGGLKPADKLSNFNGDGGIGYDLARNPGDLPVPTLRINKIEENADDTLTVIYSCEIDWGGSSTFSEIYSARFKKVVEGTYLSCSLVGIDKIGNWWSRATASSVLASDSKYSYGADMTLDDKMDTAWAEGVEGPGIGEWIKLTTKDGKEAKASGMFLYPGYRSDLDFYLANNRPQDITITFSNGKTIKYKCNGYDWESVENIPFPPGTVTSSVKITIDSVFTGWKFDDTCISKIFVY